MNVLRLLVLHKERGLSTAEISRILEIPKHKIEEILEGRIKPPKIKHSLKNFNKDGKLSDIKTRNKKRKKAKSKKKKIVRNKIILYDEQCNQDMIS